MSDNEVKFNRKVYTLISDARIGHGISWINSNGNLERISKGYVLYTARATRKGSRYYYNVLWIFREDSAELPEDYDWDNIHDIIKTDDEIDCSLI